MVEIQNLTAGYGGESVLKNLNLTFPANALTAVIGPNGCGKSTLLRSLIGLTPHVDGTIRAKGMDLPRLSSEALAQTVAYLPQNRRVPDMTVGQLVLHGRFPYLRYPRRYRREDRALAQAAMEQLDIAHLADTPLPQLSGGTQQKCYIAMTLCQDSPVILMDEPLSFLDISHQLELMALSKDLARRGKTMVMVLHDLSLALQWADQIVLMDGGSVIITGTPPQLVSGGQLEQVFGVTVHPWDSPLGTQYTFSRKEN